MQKGKRASPCFDGELTSLGWTERRNIHFDYRWVGGDAARAKADAAELASQKPDVIIANSTMSLATRRPGPTPDRVVDLKAAEPPHALELARIQDGKHLLREHGR
jgi:hypothetical protein